MARLVRAEVEEGLVHVVDCPIQHRTENVLAGLGTELCPACLRPGATSERPQCKGCGTIWIPSRRSFKYDDRYPQERYHNDPNVIASKQATLRYWLAKSNMHIVGQQVLEVGFGGGAGLSFMQQLGAVVHGQEPIEANRAAALDLGLAPDRVKADITEFDGDFDFVLYADAFEHIVDPQQHLRSLGAITRPGAAAMLVLPTADSISRRLMGRRWVHDISDHWVFYTTKGLRRLWESFGWRHTKSFYPWKCLSAKTIAQHARMKTGFSVPLGPIENLSLWLNFGERGLVFRKEASVARAG